MNTPKHACVCVFPARHIALPAHTVLWCQHVLRVCGLLVIMPSHRLPQSPHPLLFLLRLLQESPPLSASCLVRIEAATPQVVSKHSLAWLLTHTLLDTVWGPAAKLCACGIALCV